MERIGTKIVKQLKLTYPHPVAANEEGTQTGYCVGGAICIAVERMHNPELNLYQNPEASFPGEADLAEILMELYPALKDHPGLDRRCEDLITLNDQENFAAAWNVLEELLNWVPVTEPVPALVYHKPGPPKGSHREPNRVEIHHRRMAHENRGMRLRFRYVLRKGGQMQCLQK